MSGTKYASLPDIDSAPDIYETPDTWASGQKSDDSDEELTTARNRRNTLDAPLEGDIDNSSLPDTRQVGAKFRQAERRRGRFRELYSYPASDDDDASRSPSPSGRRSDRRLKPQARLQKLRAQLEELESDLAAENAGASTSDEAAGLLQAMTEMRGRLTTISSSPAVSRTSKKLLAKAIAAPETTGKPSTNGAAVENGDESLKKPASSQTSEAETLSLLDKRLASLELTIGASNATLDESSPLPQPLMPHIQRLSNILTLLSQPRQIDAVSRRLKLLQTDLERYSASQSKLKQSPSTGGASSSGANANAGSTAASGAGNAPTANGSANSTLLSSTDLALVLQRLSPILPTIPHLLTRLRTLSTLHASASGFAAEVSALEEKQRKTHADLEEISTALGGLEKSFEENTSTTAGNLKTLQERLEDVQARLSAAGR